MAYHEFDDGQKRSQRTHSIPFKIEYIMFYINCFHLVSCKSRGPSIIHHMGRIDSQHGLLHSMTFIALWLITYLLYSTVQLILSYIYTYMSISWHIY